MPRSLIALAAALLPVVATSSPAAAPRPTAAARVARLPRVPLTVATARGERRFRVEVARTPAEQERGLMFRTSLPDDGGMIFPLGRERVATFWMKNTLIPLDMIFIRRDGTIARIATARPETLDIVDSGEPVAAVLELAGGKAAALGIRAGDRVRWAS